MILYYITKEKLGDVDFSNLQVEDLKNKAEQLTLEQFQERFNNGLVNSKEDFIKISSSLI